MTAATIQVSLGARFVEALGFAARLHARQVRKGTGIPLEQPKPPWRPRKETYLRLLRSAPPDVLRVALADKVHNARSVLADLRTLGPALWARFNAPRDDQLWYFRALVDLFGRRYPGPLADELGRIVAEIERLG